MENISAPNDRRAVECVETKNLRSQASIAAIRSPWSTFFGELLTGVIIRHCALQKWIRIERGREEKER